MNTRQIIGLCWFALATLAPATAASNDSEAREVAIRKLRAATTVVRDAIHKTRAAAAEFARLAQALNESTAGSAQEQELLAQIAKVAPAFWLFDLKSLQTPAGKFVTDLEAVQKTFDSAYRKLTTELEIDCFPSDGTFLASDRCKSQLQSSCREYGSHDGGITVPVLTDELEIINLPVTSPADLEQIRSGSRDATEAAGDSLLLLLSAARERAFQFCAAAVLSGEYFDAKELAKYPVTPPMTAYFGSIHSYERLRSECFAFDVFVAELRLAEIESRFPNFHLLRQWKQPVTKRADGCQKAVQRACGATYPIKDEIILAYLTKGCEVREVTAQDVDNDIRDFATLGFTQAEQLKHSQLKDTIELCKDALGQGFVWSYVVPSTTACKNKSGDPAQPRRATPKKRQ